MDKPPLSPLEHKLAVAGGCVFLIASWLAIGLAYALAVWLGFVIANVVSALARTSLPQPDAGIVFLIALCAIVGGVTYGFRLAIEFIGEQFGEPKKPRRLGVSYSAREPALPEKTGPSAQEIDRRGR